MTAPSGQFIALQAINAFKEQFRYMVTLLRFVHIERRQRQRNRCKCSHWGASTATATAMATASSYTYIC